MSDKKSQLGKVSSEGLTKIEQIYQQINKPNSNLAFYLISLNNLLQLNLLHKDFDEKNFLNDLSKIIIENLLGAQLVFCKENSLCYVIKICNSEDETNCGAKKIYQHLQKIKYNNNLIHLSINIGAIYIDKSKQLQLPDIIDKLNIALKYSLKEDCFYINFNDLSFDIDNLAIIYNKAKFFKEALYDERLRLAFQPILDLTTNNILYYETLLRIIDDEGNITSAGPYIENAENLSYISLVDLHVINLVSDELERDKEIKLSLNLSALSISNKLILRKLIKKFAKRHIAERLHIEITESAVNKNIVLVKHFIKEVKKLGIKIAIDDFGEGYTSLSQLIDLDIDVVKIDGRYIRNILSDKTSKIFVESMIKITKENNIKLIAEFVSTKDITEYLRSIGINYIQGSYVSMGYIRK